VGTSGISAKTAYEVRTTFLPATQKGRLVSIGPDPREHCRYPRVTALILCTATVSRV
jgi:hypothetical protein